MRKWVLLIMSIFSMALLGCREVHRYDYKLIELNLLSGQFIIR